MKVESRLEFVGGLYFPGFMGISTEDYDSREGIFNFRAIEPKVCRVVDYLTPRGVHIFLSQAGYCLMEYILDKEGFDISIGQYRKLARDGRIKIVELNQKYRREIPVGENLQGKMDLKKIRWGKLPMIKIDFDIDNGGVYGNLVGVLARKPVR